MPAYHADWPHNPTLAAEECVNELVEWPEEALVSLCVPEDFSESDAYLAEFYARTQLESSAD